MHEQYNSVLSTPNSAVLVDIGKTKISANILVYLSSNIFILMFLQALNY